MAVTNHNIVCLSCTIDGMYLAPCRYTIVWGQYLHVPCISVENPTVRSLLSFPYHVGGWSDASRFSKHKSTITLVKIAEKLRVYLLIKSLGVHCNLQFLAGNPRLVFHYCSSSTSRLDMLFLSPQTSMTVHLWPLTLTRPQSCCSLLVTPLLCNLQILCNLLILQKAY